MVCVNALICCTGHKYVTVHVVCLSVCLSLSVGLTARLSVSMHECQSACY